MEISIADVVGKIADSLPDRFLWYYLIAAFSISFVGYALCIFEVFRNKSLQSEINEVPHGERLWELKRKLHNASLPANTSAESWDQKGNSPSLLCDICYYTFSRGLNRRSRISWIELRDSAGN